MNRLIVEISLTSMYVSNRKPYVPLYGTVIAQETPDRDRFVLHLPGKMQRWVVIFSRRSTWAQKATACSHGNERRYPSLPGRTVAGRARRHFGRPAGHDGDAWATA